ncbi:uncharacterized protein Tco025E_04994 [Trypanosoma conorhini]|uniref:Uncharacterized protein n=1 Tax=Trypanosoma conorhini TaxID=83891 RepID=A0A3R7L665_9TRYP|nr:uncharacterized protein Tco025E_04994 [Trypanosoma conorhini]RNF16983.1 hypothetical protein Tco025E_04994 [Trypanosoma conorhini]
MWRAREDAGSDGGISHFTHSPAASRRLYLLAAALSIPPDRLLRYTREVRRRGVHQRHRRQPQTPRRRASTARTEAGATAKTESLAQEFPLLLHGILSALVLPFSNLESFPAASADAAADAPTETTESVASFMRQGGGKSFSRQKGGGTAAALKEALSGRPQRVNMQEHFALLKEMVVSQRVRGPIPEGQTTAAGASSSGSGPTNNSSSSMSSSSCSSSGGRRRRSSTSSNSCCSSGDDEEAASVSAGTARDEVKAEGGVAAAKKVSKSSLSATYELRQTPTSREETSIAQLLSELAEPLLAARGHAIGNGTSSGSGGGESNISGMGSSVELQQCMRLVPRELRTAAGVSRVSELYPPFMPMLLEALLKESVNGSPCGLAARRVGVRLIELSAPTFVSRSFRRGSGACGEAADGDEKEMYHSMMLRATQRLATTAVSLLEVIEDPVWALDLSGSLIASQLVHPDALRAVLHRCALDLAKLPPLWKPMVALAYCLVTRHSLHAAVRADAEPCALSRPTELLDVLNETDGGVDGAAVVGNPPLHSHTSAGSSSREAGASPPLPEPPAPEPEPRHCDPQQPSPRRGASMAAEAGSGATSAVGLSTALMGRAASLTSSFLFSPRQPSGGAGVDGASQLRWLFPERVPPTVTMSNAIVMTCMVLCAGALSQHAVVALGQWCLRSLRTLPATPCAVGLTHLMLKYPQFLKKASLRVSPGPVSSSSVTAAAAAAAAAVASSTAGISSHGSGQAKTLFCVAVFMEGCRLARTVMLRQANFRMDGRLALAWQRDTSSPAATEAGHPSGFAEQPHAHDENALQELHELHCYLVMLLQSLIMRGGVQLPADAQGELFTLFLTTARLRVAVAAPKGGPTAHGSCQPPQRALSQVVLQLVDEAFGAVARAVDILLHDYDAGCPRQLCESLVSLLPPQNTLFSELQCVGAWEKHLDCLETVQAAAEAYREARRPTVSRPSSSGRSLQAEASGDAAAAVLWSSVAAPKRPDAIRRPMSLLELQRELELRANRAVAGVRSGAEVMFGSLVSVLPCSGEPLCLAATAAPDGGLPAAQQLWWVEHTLVYLVEEWWRSRVSTPAQFRLNAEEAEETSSGDVFCREAQKSFIQCCAHPI